MWYRAALIGVALISLSACGTKILKRPEPIPVTVAPTQVVTKVVEKIVTVPDELTRDCIEVPKRANSVAEAVRLANAREEARIECTGRMRQIRALGR